MKERESYIRHNLANGSVLIPFSKWDKMTDADFQNLDAGYYGRFILIPDENIDININNAEDEEFELEDVPEIDLDLDLDFEE